MIICKHCGRENEDEYKFCLGCGEPLQEEDEEAEAEQDQPETVNCPHCGKELPSDFKFCGACGGKIPEDIGSGGGPSTREPVAQAEGASEASAGRREEKGTPPPIPARDRAEAAAVQEKLGRLIVIRPDGTEGAAVELVGEDVTIGRATASEALEDDPFLSPEHASLLYRDGDYLIRDESSVNGIFYRIDDDTELRDGDQIRIGQELLRFNTFPDDPASAVDDEGTLAAGSPEPGYWGQLSLIAGPDVVSEAWALDGDEVVVGREEGDILFQDDGFVSGTHAAVALKNGRPVLRDLNSSNGTYLRIRDERRLTEGDLILMGQQLFRLETDV